MKMEEEEKTPSPEASVMALQPNAIDNEEKDVEQHSDKQLNPDFVDAIDRAKLNYNIAQKNQTQTQMKKQVTFQQFDDGLKKSVYFGQAIQQESWDQSNIAKRPHPRGRVNYLQRLLARLHLRRGRPELTFGMLFWSVFITVSFVAVWERYNWDHNNFGQLPDPVPPMKDDFHFWMFHNNERITARLMLTVTSAFFLTMSKVTQNIIAERTGLYDAFNVCFTSHKKLGTYVITILTFAHIVGAFQPLIDRDFHLTDEPFFWFVAHDPREVPFGAKGRWNIRRDDLFQGPIGLFLGLFVMPVTILYGKWRGKHFDKSMLFHALGAAAWVWLIYRIPGHVRTHKWVSIPIGLFVIDRIFHAFFYRAKKTSDIQVKKLDKDYAIVYGDAAELTGGQQSMIGDVYYWQTESRKWELSHPYTCFRQRVKHFPILTRGALDNSQRWLSEEQFRTNEQTQNNHNEKLSIGIDQSNDESEQSTRDRIGVLVRVFERKNGRLPFTYYLVNQRFSDENCLVSGPHRRIYARLSSLPCCRTEKAVPLTLVATGTGAVLLIDFMQLLVSEKRAVHAPVQIYFATHSVALFQFVADQLLRYDVPNVSVECHLTSTDPIRMAENITVQDQSKLNSCLFGRFDIEECFALSRPDTEVYFCGASIVESQVRKYSAKFGLHYFTEVPYN